MIKTLINQKVSYKKKQENKEKVPVKVTKF